MYDLTNSLCRSSRSLQYNSTLVLLFDVFFCRETLVVRPYSVRADAVELLVFVWILLCFAHTKRVCEGIALLFLLLSSLGSGVLWRLLKSNSLGIIPIGLANAASWIVHKDCVFLRIFHYIDY